MTRVLVKGIFAATAAAVALAVFATQGSVVHGQRIAAGAPQTFIVVTAEGSGVTKAVARVVATGGTVVAKYDAIGVVIARAARSDFATAVLGKGVDDAVATTGLATRLAPGAEATVAAADVPAPSDFFWPLQWDMRAIKVAEAHTVTIGSPSVVVGVLDSGIDATHPDLATQVDHSLSVSCLGGAPDTSLAAWQPTTDDHGTHVAGIIAAARNGYGTVGVAPGVRLAAVKVTDDGGFIYPEAAICGYMWAADHGFNVTNNSYFIDPWYFYCQNDPRQRPVLTAVRRALRYAASHGVLTVAAAGNSQFDLQGKSVDDTSPDDGSGPIETRVVGGNCLSLPGEIPSVVTVSATGPTGLISYYSNYGLGVVDVAAPGGDARVPGAETDTGGYVLSTIWPGQGYGYKQGTSMAAPHVAGVAALVFSTRPGLSPEGVAAILRRSADEQACPGKTYTPPGNNVVTHRCRGGKDNNGFYGRGIVDAYRAVTY